jgi:SAM-dependent methyltransferase
LPFEDNSFDAVLLLEVIEHFIMNPIFALKELGRVLRPDGVLIVTTDNSHSLIKLMKFFALRPIYWPYNDQMFGDRHNREYMAKEIADFLTGIGFQNVRVEVKNLSLYAFGKYPLKKKVGYEISNILTTLPYLTNFKRTIFAIARKGELKDYFPG